jgi:prenyltransferase beta subunit
MKRFCRILLGCLVTVTSAHGGEPGAKQTIAYVQKLQSPSGGFRSHDPLPLLVKIAPTLRATTSALRALRYFGGDIPNKDACITFVKGCHDPKTGGFRDTPNGAPDVFSTAVGLMAIIELKMPKEKYAPGAMKFLSDNAKSFEDIRIAAAGFESVTEKSLKTDDWLAQVMKMRNEDGIFGKDLGQARATGGSVVTILRLGGQVKDADRILQVLKAGQRQNGGYGKADSEIASDLETTYRVMRCFVMLKAKPANVEGVRSFVAKCRNADGGYGVAPGQTSSVSGTYFAAIITHWLKEKP